MSGSSRHSTGSSTAPPKIRVKSSVWIPACTGNEQHVFELAHVISIDDDEKKCRVKANSGPELTINVDQVQLTNPRVVPDMTSLYHINDAGILHNLKMRSEQDLPYTNMGSVLVSVNPLHPVQDPDLQPGKAMACDVPHPFAIAENAFKNMSFCFERRLQRQRQLEILERSGHDVSHEAEVELVVNQSVVISGESGSGKTESGKRVLHHLVTRTGALSESGGRGELDLQLAGVGPILEAFGNASTVCNHNSSRFGKFSKLHFVQRAADRTTGKSWTLVGATVETYLLEQSRVVNHCTGERNFHVFYQLLTGANAGQRSALGLPSRSDICKLRYLRPGAAAASSSDASIPNSRPGARGARGRGSSSSTLSSSSSGGSGGAAPPTKNRHRVNLSEEAVAAKDAERFNELCQALHDIGKSREEIDAIFCVMAGILHLGNVGFAVDEAQSSDAAKVCEDAITQGALGLAASLLGVSEGELQRLLLTKQVKAGMEVIETKLDVVAAQYARDALAKWTYGILFDWLVKEINAVLMSAYKEEAPLATLPFIGVLDIFGFESFAKNGFEQLLINYTNESLQSTFNYQVFVAEADLYKREGLILDGEPFVCPTDDGDCLDLFEGKQGMAGLLMEIDSESRAPKPTDEKLNRRLHSAFGKVKSFPRPHPKDMQATFRIAHYAGVVEYTVGDFVNKNNDRIPANMHSLMQGSSNIVACDAFGGKGGAVASRARGKKSTVVANFGGQIRGLVDTLESTKCSFIRCVKPNPEMRWARGTNWFNNEYVNEQLKCLSIPQTAAVLKSGFPTRIDYDSIVDAYASALPPDALRVWQRGNENGNKQSGRTFVAALFWAFRVPQEAFRLGLSKVFFSSGMIDLLDRIMLEAASWASDEGKDSEEKALVGRRFKLYYARMRWRRAVAKITACNRFLETLRSSRKRGAAARCMQRGARAFLFRSRLYKRVQKRIKKREEEARLARAEAERKASQQAEAASRHALAEGKLSRAAAAALFESKSGGRDDKENVLGNRLAIDPLNSPHLGKKPPLPSGTAAAGINGRQTYRSGKRLSSGWSLQGALHTPKGSLHPDLLDLVEKSQSHLKEDNAVLRQQNEKLVSDLEALKEDIALLKRSMPYTHILHLY